MHLSALYTTGPSGFLPMAPTGQADAQAGSSQCIQILRTNLSPRVSTTVKAVSERVGSGSVLNPWSCLQAVSQPRHPMQRLISMSIAFCFVMGFSVVRLPSALRQKEFLHQLLLRAGVQLEEQALDRQAAVLCQGGIELLQH